MQNLTLTKKAAQPSYRIDGKTEIKKESISTNHFLLSIIPLQLHPFFLSEAAVRIKYFNTAPLEKKSQESYMLKIKSK